VCGSIQPSVRDLVQSAEDRRIGPSTSIPKSQAMPCQPLPRHRFRNARMSQIEAGLVAALFAGVPLS